MARVSLELGSRGTAPTTSPLAAIPIDDFIAFAVTAA